MAGGYSRKVSALVAFVLHPWDDAPPPNADLEAAVYEMKAPLFPGCRSASEDDERGRFAAVIIATFHDAARAHSDVYYFAKFMGIVDAAREWGYLPSNDDFDAEEWIRSGAHVCDK